MKITSVLLAMTLMVFLAIGVVAADIPETTTTTIVGKIYNADFSDTISNATVIVTCDGNNETTMSDVLGSYGVSYSDADCPVNSTLLVYAEKGNLSGMAGGDVNDANNLGIDVNLGVVNVPIDVPLVPEFGLILGSLTIVGSIVVFFIIRRQ